MPSFNQVTLMGNISTDIELRYTGSGTAVGSMNLAVNRSYKNQQGNLVEDTCFINITMWGKVAERCNQYLTKGDCVLVEGYLKFEKWADKTTGENRSKHSVSADQVEFIIWNRDGRLNPQNQNAPQASNNGKKWGPGQSQRPAQYNEQDNMQL